MGIVCILNDHILTVMIAKTKIALYLLRSDSKHLPPPVELHLAQCTPYPKIGALIVDT